MATDPVPTVDDQVTPNVVAIAAATAHDAVVTSLNPSPTAQAGTVK